MNQDIPGWLEESVFLVLPESSSHPWELMIASLVRQANILSMPGQIPVPCAPSYRGLIPILAASPTALVMQDIPGQMQVPVQRADLDRTRPTRDLTHAPSAELGSTQPQQVLRRAFSVLQTLSLRREAPRENYARAMLVSSGRAVVGAVYVQNAEACFRRVSTRPRAQLVAIMLIILICWTETALAM